MIRPTGTQRVPNQSTISNPYLMIVALAAALAIPTPAFASGGGPILVMFCLSVFLPGIVPIFLAELAVYWGLTRIPFRTALLDCGKANLASFILVFLLGPVAIALPGLLFSAISPVGGDLALAASTWVYDSATHAGLAKTMTIIWTVVLGILGVLLEARIFELLWGRRDEAPRIGAIQASLLCNLPTTLAAVMFGLFVWRELFF